MTDKKSSTASWYPRYVGDYMRDTGHLSLAEDGAYNRLLDHYYASRAPLPVDNESLHRICRAMTKTEQDAVDKVSSIFFVVGDDGLYHNNKADKVIAEQSAKSASAAASAAASWGPNAKRKVMRTHMRTHSEGICGSDANQNQNQNQNQKPESEPEKTTTTSSEGEGGGGLLIEFKEGATKTQIIDGLSGLRHDYKRIQRAAWEECFKVNGAKPEHFISAANAFIKADANSVEPYKAPARYFAGIIKKTLEDAGVQTETHGEKMERIKKEARRR